MKNSRSINLCLIKNEPKKIAYEENLYSSDLGLTKAAFFTTKWSVRMLKTKLFNHIITPLKNIIIILHCEQIKFLQLNVFLFSQDEIKKSFKLTLSAVKSFFFFVCQSLYSELKGIFIYSSSPGNITIGYWIFSDRVFPSYAKSFHRYSKKFVKAVKGQEDR